METFPLVIGQTLDGFASEAGNPDGIDIRLLDAGSVVIVDTQRSRYRLDVLDGPTRHVLVSGGRQFPVPTEVVLAGATGMGSMLKIGWLGVGLKMEFKHGRHRIITSTVTGFSFDHIP